MTALVAAISGIYGLVIGSFLNVVIWRVPRKESIVTPPSHCPGCDAKIANRDNIPVLSWLMLRGRCRECATSISARYPLVEILTALLFAAVGARFAHSWALPAFLVLAGALVALSIIDLEHYVLPNRIIYPVDGALLVLLAGASALEHDWGAFGRALVGGAAAFAVFFVIHLVSPRGMGFGDVRLSFLLGLALGWLGWGEVAGGLFAGFLYGAVIGVALIAVKVKGRKQQIPFGPFLALGAMTFVLFGRPVLDWYHHIGR
ncbi:MAG: leader peptidase (prepilin peptidase) / N-methyltransferase [Actinomycetota bacterium]|nr:leader peptidase (prepilin peptidase) / N-methyltransferase [Actinomycetota bacterium]